MSKRSLFQAQWSARQHIRASAPPYKKTGPSKKKVRFSGCQKSPRTFPTACKNAVTFAPRSGAKVLAALAERLAVQGIQGIRSRSRRAAAPSRSPAKTEASSTQQRFFDKLLSSASVSRAASAAYRVMTSINVIMVELSSMVPIFFSFHSSRSW